NAPSFLVEVNFRKLKFIDIAKNQGYYKP
ncbi:MAG: hypothetical protein ACJAT1_002486, partial [Marivirga sp.]